MERVAFLVERTGERINCLLNPETFTVTRQAGVRPRRTLSGVLSGSSPADDLLLATGGGSTELQLELLFDVSKQTAPQPAASVQALTAPLWQLAENSDDSDGAGTPAVVRFVWGKAWNIPGVVVSVAERFEDFTAEGIARRSWIRLRLMRCGVPGAERAPQAAAVVALPEDAPSAADLAPESLRVHELKGEGDDGGDEGLVERIDQLAARYYGDASAWRLIAAFNGIDDPLHIPAGTRLLVPPRSEGA
jgi:hypothetical protein